MNAIITAEGLVKSFGSHRAVDGLSLEVNQGTVCGLLGPNGSGKSTTVSMLATLLRPDAGSATIAGADLLRRPHQVRRRIGLSGQYAAVDENLTGFENLEMIGRLYHLGRRRAAARAQELLERMALIDAGHRAVKTYSGGMRRRLDLAGAVVASVPVIFLDEPTTGLDPQSRNALWKLVGDLVADGTTVLLTTQYLEEADQLADDIIVIDHGRVIAEGKPDELKSMVGGERIETVLNHDDDAAAAIAALEQVAVGSVRRDGRVLVAPVDGGAEALSLVLDRFRRHRIETSEVGLRRPSLDDVFLALTGRLSDGDGDSDGEQDEPGGARPVALVGAEEVA